MARAYAVVIPARNEARHIGEALQSVFAQTIPPAEVIVADDASTDDTAVIAARCGARVLRYPTSVGPSALRNRTVEVAKSPIIAFLDADDVWKPQHAERVLAAMRASQRGFAGSAAERFGSATGVVRTPFALGHDAPIADNLIIDNPIIQSTVFIERDLFLRAGGYDEQMRLSEDYDLWQRVAQLTEYAPVTEVTVRRRMHAAQTSVRQTANLIRAAWLVRRRAALARITTASAAGRRHLLSLLEQAARSDIAWAVWTGQAAMLRLVREELGVTDAAIGDGLSLAALGGRGAIGRRVALEVRTRVRGTYFGLIGASR